MSATPAALLARLRVLHPAWTIAAVTGPDQSGYCARRADPASPGEQQVITAASLGGLERGLINEDHLRSWGRVKP